MNICASTKFTKPSHLTHSVNIKNVCCTGHHITGNKADRGLALMVSAYSVVRTDVQMINHNILERYGQCRCCTYRMSWRHCGRAPNQVSGSKKTFHEEEIPMLRLKERRGGGSLGKHIPDIRTSQR